MAIPSSYQLYQSILQRAADEWGVPYEDVDRDIAQSFDPMVRFMAGATASEIEKVYHYMNDAEQRITDRLLRMLVPEPYHFAKPAHALAVADPKKSAVLLDETIAFQYKNQETAEIFDFSPIFPMKIVPVKIKILATENKLLELHARSRRRKNQENDVCEFKHLLIGLELNESIRDWKNVCLWFDVVGTDPENHERAALFKGLQQMQVMLQGSAMRIKFGLPAPEENLQQYLNGIFQLKSELSAKFNRHFITFLDEDIEEKSLATPNEYLNKWFAHSDVSKEDIDQFLKGEMEEPETPLLWMVLQFKQSQHISHIDNSLKIRFNVFPVMNRKRNGVDQGDHYFFQKNSLKWIHLTPEIPFLSIRKVYQDKAPDYAEFEYKPFSDFREDKNPSFTVRYGGLSRWDDFNAWKRLAYLVALFQENYTHDELIQKAASSLSLEDLHVLLGKKIDQTNENIQQVKDIYILLNPGRQSGLRVRVEYWTTSGSKANHIPAKSSLSCSVSVETVIDSNSIELLSMTTGGTDPLNRTALIDALRYSIASRDRLVTREDVRSFCKLFLEGRIKDVTIVEGAGIDPSSTYGITRRLEVWIDIDPAYAKEDWESTCHQLKQILESKSSQIIPLWVGTRQFYGTTVGV